MNQKQLELLYKLRDEDGLSWKEIEPYFSGMTANALRKSYYRNMKKDPISSINDKKILLLDIETSPIEALVWGLYNQNIPVEMVKKPFTILSYSAKWLGKSEVMYNDTRNKKDPRDDKKLVLELRKLIDQADYIITQNGIKFDLPVIEGRLFYHKLNPPSSHVNIDTLRISKRFKLVSHKLQYMTNTVCTKFKKLMHKKYPGTALWLAVLDKDINAWKEMELYNKMDVLSLEELYVDHLRKWDKKTNFYGDDSALTSSGEYACSCGNKKFKRHGFAYTKTGNSYKRFICTKCGHDHVIIGKGSKEKIKPN